MENSHETNRVGISTQTSVEATATGAGSAPIGDESPVAEPNLTSNMQTQLMENQQPSFQPTRSVSEAAQPLTTLAGLTRRRIQWSNEMNQFIIRAYFRTTRCETSMPGYRQRLHLMFVEEYPHLGHVTEQNIADRRLAIIRKKLISSPLIDTIRAEVASELNGDVVEELASAEAVSENNQEVPGPPYSADENNNDISNTNVDQESCKLRDELNSALTKFSFVDPVLRPKLPKQQQGHILNPNIQRMNNVILPGFLPEINNYMQLDTLLYCSAYAILTTSGRRIHAERAQRSAPKKREPPWIKRLSDRIEALRKEAGVLSAFNIQPNSRKLRRRAIKIKQKYVVHGQYSETNNTHAEALDTIKQKISLYAKRLRRYKQSKQRSEDNNLFNRSQKSFFDRCRGKAENSSQPPNIGVLENFWSGIWSSPSQHNQSSQLLQQNDETNEITPMQECTVSTEDFQIVVKRLQNWKASGIDGLHNYWLKSFVSLHETMRREINKFIQNPSCIPDYLCEGITYLIPKEDSYTEDPSKFRPITCLNTFYKLTTSCVAELINRHCLRNNIIAEQQKGCRKGSLGCKEQLTIDAVVTGQACSGQRNLFAAFIDYKKAFDMVPHSWLLETLRLYKINPQLVSFCEVVMTKWCTKLKAQKLTSKLIQIKRGIFQGDSLSPLWFCLSINPLSYLLNKSKYGFEIKSSVQSTRITHLMYMDDIKLYSSSANSLEQLLKIVEKFSNDIKMEFGVEKCKTIQIVRGKMTKGLDYITATGKTIQSLEEGEFYKYLGMEQSRRIDHTLIKSRLNEIFKCRVEQLLKTLLNSRNMITAINTYAVPIITYSAGIVKWSSTDLESLERKVRTLMTKYRQHHPKSAIERLVIPRDKGGRGLISIQNLVEKQNRNLFTYFSEKAPSSSLHSAILHADDNFTPVNMKNTNPLEQLTQSSQQNHFDSWKSKPLHGRHPNELYASNIDLLVSNSWLSFGNLFPETEGFMVAIQDQVLPTRNYLKFIVKDQNIVTDDCRRCGAQHETIQHILAGCTVLVSEGYKRRHDNIGKILHQELLKKYGILSSLLPYYKYNPESVIDCPAYLVYWDRTILTDTSVPCNRPDIVIYNKMEKNIILVDFAVVNNNNLESTYSTKIQKYTALCFELKDLWRANTAITIPVIISTTGLVPKTTILALERLGVPKRVVYSMQKSVILDSCRLVREFLAL